MLNGVTSTANQVTSVGREGFLFLFNVQLVVRTDRLVQWTNSWPNTTQDVDAVLCAAFDFHLNLI